MFLILTLGNPGSQYERTRHNAGFLVGDELAKRMGETFVHKASVEAELAEGKLGNERVIVVKPQTYMNLSGVSLQSLLAQRSIPPENIVVVYDEADIPFGEVRVRTSGSAAGHNGMKSILNLFPEGTAIARVRIGIGRSPNPEMPLDAWVLAKWTPEEASALPAIIAKATNEVERIVTSSDI